LLVKSKRRTGLRPDRLVVIDTHKKKVTKLSSTPEELHKIKGILLILIAHMNQISEKKVSYSMLICRE